MNDQTPRKYRGSLLERAAARAPASAPPIPTDIELPPVPRRPAAAPQSPTPMAAMAMRPVLVDEPVARAPRKPRRRVAIDHDALRARGMLEPGASVTVLAEEFRMVKRQLLLTARKVAGADADRSRMILVCSAKPDEGKTFCAINLALSMASEKDHEILLVDADFAKPDVLKRLGLEEGVGLLDALAGDIDDVEDCVLDTDIPNLTLLPAGTRSHLDTELLASARARSLLDALAAGDPRRIVIFDSPPALAASPASVLALQVGQALMVVRADRTNEGDLREAVAALDGCEHIQLLLNAVSYQPGGHRFGTYYDYRPEDAE